MPELVRAVAGAVRDGATVERVLEAVEELARFPAVELLEPERAPGRPARFTTRELLDVEREGLDVALAGRDAGAPRALPWQGINDAGLVLSAEQRRLVREGCLSPDRVLCAVGVAGAGKTTALRLLGASFDEAGVPVLGAAPSGRAADELARATGIHSRTLHRLLLDARQRGGLPQRSVLVVDEAGMAETRVLAPVLGLVEEAGGKAILVGDPAQLPAVGAGGLFTALCDRLGPVTLDENHRQLDPTERAALAHLRAGDPEPYLAHAAFCGRLHHDENADVAKQRLLADWWHAAERNPRGRVMLAYRRSDVHELNEVARHLLLQAGRLGDEALTAGEREFRIGDRVLCRQNDTRLLVRNGTRGTIIDLDPSAQTLTLEIDAGPHRLLPAAYAAEHLEHGYALTGHAAQGATFEHAFVLLREEGALHEWGYVVLSRAHAETRIYLAEGGREREAHGRAIDYDHGTTRLADALTRPANEQLALETTRARPDPREARRAYLEEACARAEQRLGEARGELEELGWWQRRRHGPELRTELAFRQAALEHTRDRLVKHLREPLGTSHDRVRKPEISHRRFEAHRTHERAIARERDLGIDL